MAMIFLHKGYFKVISKNNVRFYKLNKLKCNVSLFSFHGHTQYNPHVKSVRRNSTAMF